MTLRPIAALLFAAAAAAAHADVVKWIDDQGRVTYSNTPPPAVAGKAQAVEDRISVMGMDPSVRAWAERRFAQQAYADELDWRLRQQAMAASYYSQPAGSPYGSSTPYASPVYGYGYAVVRRPVATRTFFSGAPRMTHASHAGHSSHGSRGR